MAEQFLLEDVFNVMIELESLGNVLYAQMSKMTNEAKLRLLFEKLSEVELAHKELYMGLKQEVVAFNREKVNDEYKAYMTSLLKETIRFLTQNQNVTKFEEGYHVAVRLEEDTILFLNALRQIVDSGFYVVIDEIIEQEKMHLKSLAEYKHFFK